MDRTAVRPKSFGTHDGTFHADEVTACALLLLFGLIDTDKITRSRDIAILQRCEYVCDVGGAYEPDKKLFDHHQAGYQGRMSSAGMILLHLFEAGRITKNEYDYFNLVLIMGVDDHDNGLDPQTPGICTYSHVISNYNPIVYDSKPEVVEESFYEALQFALSHASRLLDRYHYIQSCKAIVTKAMENNSECLMFEKAIPWMDIFFELGGEQHPARFLIMPSGKHWKLRGIPPNRQEKMQVRQPLPLEWAGCLEQELKEVTGIPGAVFCHKGRFISVWETREDALAALQYILNTFKGKL